MPCELNKSFMDRRVRENFTAPVGAGCHKIDRRFDENRFESTESLSPGSFGGHRPPLQLCPQSRQQFLVDVVETAVAKNGDDVFLFQQRHDAIDNRVRVFFVKRRTP